MLEKAITGEIDEQGNQNPNKITFVFKTGYTSEAEAPPLKKAGRPSEKNSKAETVEFEEKNTCSQQIRHPVGVFEPLY